ncbi:hypothetical protein Poly51_59810 [Rubripirellula tenax]|uniref:Uncharacterized protein n=1 Tax=Rubripirellula tenax TaxID=2528015 RepID=A0A5C6E6Y5_9BACT|nr:hypothetical protein Poly51_59810 [Rubripirellula tenax]
MAWKIVHIVASEWTDAVTAIAILLLVAYSVIHDWTEIPVENLRVNIAVAILGLWMLLSAMIRLKNRGWRA